MTTMFSGQDLIGSWESDFKVIQSSTKFTPPPDNLIPIIKKGIMFDMYSGMGTLTAKKNIEDCIRSKNAQFEFSVSEIEQKLLSKWWNHEFDHSQLKSLIKYLYGHRLAATSTNDTAYNRL